MTTIPTTKYFDVACPENFIQVSNVDPDCKGGVVKLLLCTVPSPEENKAAEEDLWYHPPSLFREWITLHPIEIPWVFSDLLGGRDLEYVEGFGPPAFPRRPAPRVKVGFGDWSQGAERTWHGHSIRDMGLEVVHYTSPKGYGQERPHETPSCSYVTGVGIGLSRGHKKGRTYPTYGVDLNPLDALDMARLLTEAL